MLDPTLNFQSVGSLLLVLLPLSAWAPLPALQSTLPGRLGLREVTQLPFPQEPSTCRGGTLFLLLKLLTGSWTQTHAYEGRREGPQERWDVPRSKPQTPPALRSCSLLSGGVSQVSFLCLLNAHRASCGTLPEARQTSWSSGLTEPPVM